MALKLKKIINLTSGRATHYLGNKRVSWRVFVDIRWSKDYYIEETVSYESRGCCYHRFLATPNMGSENYHKLAGRY